MHSLWASIKFSRLPIGPDSFTRLGFAEVDKQRLPQKIWADCVKCVKFPDCDEIAMLLEL
jgi:amino-acid N-acetyltransferase